MPPHALVSKARIMAAVAHLRGGGLVCVPTETTYGLAADIRDPSALAALLALKGRDPRNPFGLIAADIEQVRTLARDWPPLAEILAARYWPGPLTLVIPARPTLPSALIGPGGGVGVRIPSHPVPISLARALGGPITATSANPTGMPAALDIATARRYFGDTVFYLDAGRAKKITASTVAAIAARTTPSDDAHNHRARDTDAPLRILREGPIDLSAYLADNL